MVGSILFGIEVWYYYVDVLILVVVFVGIIFVVVGGKGYESVDDWVVLGVCVVVVWNGVSLVCCVFDDVMDVVML